MYVGVVKLFALSENFLKLILIRLENSVGVVTKP